MATAFHRNTLTNSEGGTNDEEFRNVAIVDRVNTTMQVWMGVTMACAQCHTHKYDPLSQEEYFRLFAIFNNTEDADRKNESPTMKIFSAAQKKERLALQGEIARLEKSMEAATATLKEGQARWEASFRSDAKWRDLRTEGLKQAGENRWTFDVRPGSQKITAFRLKSDSTPKISLTLVPPATARPNGRIVRISLAGKKKMVSLAEVQVFSGGENVARKGAARQSSTAFSGPARLAIDGNTNGHYFNAKSTTHTAVSDNPWWEVDLKADRRVDRIVVWNRTDSPGIGERLRGFRVSLLDAKRKVAWETKPAKVPAPSLVLSTGGARAVEISLAPRRKGEQLLVPAGPLQSAEGTRLEIALSGRRPTRLHLSATDDPHIALTLKLPADVQAALQIPAPKRSPAQLDAIAKHYRSLAPELKGPRDRIVQIRKQLDGGKAGATLPIMRELAKSKRRKTHVQIRGNFLAKDKEVTEGIPAVFHPFPAGEPMNRLGLARWLVHPDNPLTARVLVNRYWEQIFGTGLVRTGEDFGIRGEPPSHPRLLDWLATEVVRLKWDVKELVRLLVTSAAYRQSARVTPDLEQRDPSNRLLARGPRLRLSAEMIRDQALFVSGLLSRKMFGPSVRPPRPNLGLRAAFGGSTDWKTSPGEDMYRRGLYTTWRRSLPYPSMAAFDAPSREVCIIKRSRTNTPLQALVTMNDPVYVGASQALARRALAEGGMKTRERATYAFRLCLARPPRPVELDRIVALVAEARTRFAKDKTNAQKMATVPLGPAPKGADVVELAAWTVVGNVLLNLDEMFMKR